MNQNKPLKHKETYESIAFKLSQIEISNNVDVRSKVLLKINNSPLLKKVDSESLSLASQLRIYKIWSAVSTCALLIFLNLNPLHFQMSNFEIPSQKINLPQKNQNPVAYTEESYVIHVDVENLKTANVITHVEVRLPEGLQFVSKNLSSKNKMKLPLNYKLAGRSKLPFVLKSNSVGLKNIEIQFLDENNNIIEKKNLKLNFAKKDGETAL